MVSIIDFQTVLKKRRAELNLTQQELADQLHVTRQTLSRWENGLSYPNLDTLVALSEVLHVSLDTLLKGDNNTMVEKISTDVRNKRKYKRLFVIISLFIGLLSLWLGLLGYGRANQIDKIDYFNPFLKTTYGYAVLPTPGQAKGVTLDKNKWIDPHGKVDAQVMDDPLSSGDWIKFYTGQYTKQTHYAVIKHKGSYVYSIQLINKNQMPKLMQIDQYYPKSKNEPRVAQRFSWWPFS